MKGKTLYIIIAILIVGFVFFLYSSHKQVALAYWGNTNIKCLPNGHADVSTHSHVKLEIVIFNETTTGKQEIVPANVGISSTCMAEVHTHEADNTIHIETRDAGAKFTLGDFYLVWGQEINRSGFGLDVFVDGKKVWGPVVDDMKIKLPEDIIPKDGQTIRLEYTNKG